MKKFWSILLIALIATTTLFAQGVIELDTTKENPVKVIGVSTNEQGYPDFTVIDTDGNEIVYHTFADTNSTFPLSSITVNDVLAIQDNGISTLSLPPQRTAKSVRYITYGAGYYGLSFPVVEQKYPAANTASSILWDVVLEDDLMQRFSYGYGYLTLENFKAQGLTIRGAYFAKGISDFYENADPVISMDDMDATIQTYITDIYSAGIEQDTGASYGSLDLIKELELTEELSDRFAYSYGYMIAASLYYNGIDVLPQQFIEGALTSIYSLEPVLTEDAMNDYIQQYAAQLEAEYNEAIEQLKAENLAMADSFLAQNATRPEVVALASGVQYEVTAEGDGATPSATDTVVINYTLRDLSGQILDQGSEISFPLTSVIPGFSEAVSNMKVGQSIIAYIPPALGYGENGTGSIEPNSLLVFEIDLISITK